MTNLIKNYTVGNKKLMFCTYFAFPMSRIQINALLYVIRL